MLIAETIIDRVENSTHSSKKIIVAVALGQNMMMLRRKGCGWQCITKSNVIAPAIKHKCYMDVDVSMRRDERTCTLAVTTR